jgi:hypothetical protein
MSFYSRLAWPGMLLLGGLQVGCTGLESPTTNRNSGKPAWEIIGTDADDQTFKLSDYRGKVVLLEFWREI